MKRNKYLFVLLLSFVLFISSCVSKKKYYQVVDQNLKLKKDSTDLTFQKEKISAEIEFKNVKINSLHKDSIARIMRFDTTVNNLLKQANANVNKMNDEYRLKMYDQIERANNQAFYTINSLLSELIDNKSLLVKNANNNIQILINIDSVYNKDSMMFNDNGIKLIKELNSGEFKNALQSYRIYGTNEFTLKDVDGSTQIIKSPSLIYDEFTQEINQLKVYFDENINEELLHSDSKIINQVIKLNFSKGFDDLNTYYIPGLAVNGEIIIINEYPEVASSGIATARENEISISYPPKESVKYLLYPTDYLLLGFENDSDENILNKLKDISANEISRKSVTIMRGNDKQSIRCDCIKSILVVHNNKVIKKYPRRKIHCNQQVLNLEQ